jgi:hypothetical protein
MYLRQTNWLMLFREIIIIYFDKYTKHIDSVRQRLIS